MPLLAGLSIVAVAILVVAAALRFRAPGAEGDRRSVGLLRGRVALFLALYWAFGLLALALFVLMRSG